MDTTVIINDVAARVAVAGSDGFWLTLADAQRISGWDVTPEGACQGTRCVPLPPGVVGRDGLIDLAGLARHLGQPALHDATHDVWVIGEAAEDLRERMLSLEAPDFMLPDLGDRAHSLSDYRGKKVFLVTWASW